MTLYVRLQYICHTEWLKSKHTHTHIDYSDCIRKHPTKIKMNHFDGTVVHFILICINYVSSSSYSIKWLHISLLHHTFPWCALMLYAGGLRAPYQDLSHTHSLAHSLAYINRIFWFRNHFNNKAHSFDLISRSFHFIWNFIFIRGKRWEKVHYIVLVCCNLGLVPLLLVFFFVASHTLSLPLSLSSC